MALAARRRVQEQGVRMQRVLRALAEAPQIGVVEDASEIAARG